VEVLALVAHHPQGFLTNTEVFQELLHRYLALRQWEHGRNVFRDFAQLLQDRVAPVLFEDAQRAAELANSYRLGARDLIHVAVMVRLGVRQIVSADKGFDQIADIERLDPADVESWQGSIV
jgi:predicted nucleic acid-binding protein